MNVILVLVDALRADHLGCYGYGRKTSPFIDRMAKQGAIFRNAVAAASFTMPSHKAILTSVYDYGGNLEKLNPGIETLAELLQKNGVETAAFISNAVTARQSGLDKGFSYFDEGLGKMETGRGEKGQTAAEAAASALKWIEGKKGKSFFCFLQVVDTHGPYIPPKEFVEMFKDKQLEEQNKQKLAFSSNDLGYKSIPQYQQVKGENKLGQYVARYDAAIRFVDSELERLWKKLQELGIEKETVLIVTSDHGESMGEHGWLFCHGINLYEESIRVPLVFSKAYGKAHSIKEQAGHLDLAPTVLEMFGFQKGRRMQGESLMPLLKGQSLKREELFIEMHSDVQSKMVDTVVSAVRAGKWKYIETRNLKGEGQIGKSAVRIMKGTRKFGLALVKSTASKSVQLLPKMLMAKTGSVSRELYDLEKDKGEKKNLASKNRQLVDLFGKKLQGWRERQKRIQQSLPGIEKKIDATDEMKERLKKLGYFT
ncbi:MAG: sulfatase [Candidatus Diapherotrites archaeon]|uniref:Sulfatase n=1 Tax=Candidatus Iainarchaeum sp. TaxID=3101447 RepID=A0A939CAE8_9ARCH|nr:sulfatase [Candidatus Diapherotrites archaeon]